ncbi:hypothetical protein F0562_028458 [Nyssa sinensis]|uniref:BHLH domain-containing protein n=1 Tax=Nyssa sinensis TaxID=561372 RepID=A0A5J5B0A1_9ASTE|nr:hypothetical protein F0562_028458 [Nyssa sinensis]
MNIVQNLMERHRHLVGLKSWDYCVLWKLSEDQRFLEWMDCCCAGAKTIQNGEEELLFPVSSVIPCRDVMFQHPRAKSCDLLVQLPSSLPLDSGIHAEALISNQPRWLNFSSNSDSSVLEETFGTRVLVPVPGGLIELFVAQQVSEDQQVIDFITPECNISLEYQAMINSSSMDTSFSVNINSINETQSKPFLLDGNDHQKDPNNPVQPPFSPATTLENLNQQLPYDISVDRIQHCNSPMNFLQQFNYTSENRTKNDMFFEGTNESFLADKPLNPFKSSAENGFEEMDALQKPMNNTGNMHMHIMEPLGNKEQHGNDKDSIKHEMGRSESISDCSDPNDDEDDAKYRRRNGKGPQSKNLEAERRRRKKLNDRLYALRALVPKISKLDRASILGDAIEFVKELQKQVKDLQQELEEQSDEEGAKNTSHKNGPSEILNQNGFHPGPKPEHEKASDGFHLGLAGNNVFEPSKQNHQYSDSSIDKAPQMEPQVEVVQLDGNEFFVKVFCLVSNVFEVEMDSEMVQADHVRDSLLEITRNPSAGWPDMAKASENDNGRDYHHHHHHNHNTHNHNPHIQSQQHHHHRNLHHLHN